MKLTIDRQKWLRGEGSEDSFLLRHDGKMCCLGFYSLACGLKPENIEGMSTVDEAIDKNGLCQPNEVAWLIDRNNSKRVFNSSAIANTLMCVNDDVEVRDARREDSIAEIFAEYGVEVEFIN